MIKQLNDAQIREMSLEEKDQWWLDNIYKGNMKQLTLKSALTGIILGGILSLTNLYIGIRTGWSLGVGVTSVILSFAFFKALSKSGICEEMTLLENNAMQSIATASGYMSGPLVSSIPAYMLITQQTIPMIHVMVWVTLLSILGVLFAFPLKRHFINDAQLPFPEGRAAGVVMHNLHADTGEGGLSKAKILTFAGFLAALIELLRAETVLKSCKLGFLALPGYWDDFIYKFATPAILGTPLKDLTIRLDSSIIMIGAGGLMGINTGLSLLVGGVVNYGILAPLMIHNGVISGGGFRNITMWALWGGVAMMTTSSLYSFLSTQKAVLQLFSGMWKKPQRRSDVLKGIELPMKVFFIGIPLVGLAVIYCAKEFFQVSYLMSFIAIPLVFIFTIISVSSTGLTSITPLGALGKLTQLTFSALAPNNIKTNVMTASITGEVASNASNLLMDIKPGYMLGAKPRHQAIGHVLGVLAGAMLAVPIFYLIFKSDISLLTSEKLPLPGAQVWRAVAEILTKGLGFLHSTAQVAILVGGLLGIVFEVIRQKTAGKFPLSGVGVGLAFVLPFPDILAMFLGSFICWAAKKKCYNKGALSYRVLVENSEVTCAGVVAGGAIIGICIILLETVL